MRLISDARGLGAISDQNNLAFIVAQILANYYTGTVINILFTLSSYLSGAHNPFKERPAYHGDFMELDFVVKHSLQGIPIFRGCFPPHK